MKKKCEERGVSFDVLTDDEKKHLQKEIEAEQKGMFVADSVLDDPDIFTRKIK